MNIIVFSHDLPWPANHGGRIDVYNRLKAFKELGNNIFLVAWANFEDNNCDESFNHIRQTVTDLVCFPKRTGLRGKFLDISAKAILLAGQSSVVTQCSLSKMGFKKLLKKIEEFSPDAFFVESVYAAKLASKFSRITGVPLFIRSHNIEHNYLKKQALLSKSLKEKLKFLAMNSNLKAYEKFTLKNADAVFDISLSDLKFWNQQGLTNVYWMPPIYYAQKELEEVNGAEKSSFDITYVGNLNSPNNIEGLFWFFKTVLPNVISTLPQVKILVAGSNPEQNLIDYCFSRENIELIANPNNLPDLYRNSKVLINPILSGSGVNIKTIEILQWNKPVVCTYQAIRGLPDEFEKIFTVTDDPNVFGYNILRLLEIKETSSKNPKDSLLKYFHPNYLISSIDIMKEICEARKVNL